MSTSMSASARIAAFASASEATPAYTSDEAASAPAERHGSPRIESLERDLGALTTQNRQLLKTVSRLLDLYETEKAQRQSLQNSLERVVEEIAAVPSARGSEALARDVRQAVSDDLKPLLHAIIDLLEITMRRTPFDIGAAPQESAPASPEETEDKMGPSEAEPGAAARLEPPDDLPRDLPQILIKPVEELVGNARRDPSRKAPAAEPAPSGQQRSVPNRQESSSAWIPVTSDTA